MKFNRFWLSKPVIKLTAGNNGLIPGSSFCDNCPSFPFFPLFPLYPGGPGSPGGPGGPGTTLSLPGGPGGPGCPSAGPGGPYDGNVKYRFYMYLLGWGNPQKKLINCAAVNKPSKKAKSFDDYTTSLLDKRLTGGPGSPGVPGCPWDPIGPVTDKPGSPYKLKHYCQWCAATLNKRYAEAF